MSEQGDEPPLSRQRVSRACDLCRKKKVKCDGATPVCTNCKGVGLECTFKDMTKKRGPPKGYIEAIENRLYKLENYLAELAKGGDIQSKELLSELNSPLETPTGEQIRARPTRRAPKSERNKVFFWQQDKAGKKKREMLTQHESNHHSEHDEEEQHEEQEDNKVYELKDESFGQLAMDENGQVRYLGKSSGYYLLQNSRTYQNGAFHFGNYGNRPKMQPLIVDPLELPPKDLSEHLIHLYFNHFYPLLPLFYKRQLYSVIDNPIEQITPLLLNSIYAIASRISNDVRTRSNPNLPDTAGDIFFERAMKLLDESYDTPSIATVQSLLLLASHQHGRMKSARAWLYSGMAFRMAQDLGLHRNCDTWNNISKDECERRKRVFWCCYTVDKLYSAMYGRATTFEEKDCDVPFPSVNDNYDILTPFINLIKICDILGNVLKNIYYVKSLQHTKSDAVLTLWNKKLHQWYDQLPDSLQLHSNSSTTICQLHMIYHTTVILLHRPFIHQTLISSLLPCSSICNSAADSILSITNQMYSQNTLQFAMNFTVYYLFTSGIIFINQPDKVKQCMKILDQIEYTWTTASKSCQILAELSNHHHLHLSPQSSQHSSPLIHENRQNTSNLRFPVVHLGMRQEQSPPSSSSSVQNMEFNVPNLFQTSTNSSTMDPFAAPGIIPTTTSSRQDYDTAGQFWSVPPTTSSLDINEWNNLMSNNQPQRTQHEQEEYNSNTIYTATFQEKDRLIHRDQNVDMLSGVSMPLEQKSSHLLDYLPPHQQISNSTRSNGDLDSAYYW